MQNTTKKEFYLTKEGVDRLRGELDELVAKRPAIAQSLKEAKDYGDLSENSQWDDAKDQQAFIEGRISELEHILRNVVIIESKGKGDKVALGSTVHLELEGGKQVY